MKKSIESNLSLVVACGLAAVLGCIFRMLWGFEFSGTALIIYFLVALLITINGDNLIETAVLMVIIVPIFFGLWHQYSGYLIRKHELTGDATFILSHGAESLVGAMLTIVLSKFLFAIAKSIRKF